MCEYCGCQAIPAIVELTAEHDQALDFVHDIEVAARAQDAPTAGRAAGALAHLLAQHIAVEEQALFPAVAREHPEHIGILLGEHDLIEHALEEMSEAGDREPGWDRRLLRAIEVLRRHIFKEQDGVFPAALAILGPDDWERMAQVRVRFIEMEAVHG